ncbi:MAG: hemolysin III family protein [Eubacteriales bacterium]
MQEQTEKFGRYTLGEEIFASVSHGVGIVFAISATTLLITGAVLFGDTMSVVSAAIYGFTLTLMYTMSTLYHAFPYPRVKAIFRIFDHCSIFLLIAGTYTPISLAGLRGTQGWILFAVNWGCAVIGIILNVISIKRFAKLSIVLYVIMGWMVFFTIRDVFAMLTLNGFIFLMAGGVFYMGGLIFYGLKKVRYTHAVWHLCVVAGSFMHFLCVLLYVLPV